MFMGEAPRLSALGIAAIQAGVAAIHHYHCSGAALRTQLRAFREMRLREGVRLLRAGLEFRALLFDQLALMNIELGLFQQADGLQMALDDVAQFGDGRGHELAARLPVAALRIED